MMNIATSILSDFAEIADFRSERNTIHPLVNVIGISILAVIGGADTWVDIERYGKSKASWLSSFLDLSHGIPSHDTFARVFRWLDPEAFQNCFIKWTTRLCEASGGRLLSIDGKQLRRSHDRKHGREAIWMVSAWSSENRMVLGQRKVDDKSNEITAIPELLAQLDLQNCLVTLDALNTQTEIAEQIVAGEADYILAVKGNQGRLYEDLIALFDGFEADAWRGVRFDSASSETTGHGRQEFRQVWVVSEPSYLDYLERKNDWKQLKSLIKLVTRRNDKLSTRYFISSCSGSAKYFLQAIRQHWQIENGLHWVLDIAFREDESRIRRDNAPQNMAVLRRLALNLLKQETSVKVGIAAKRKMAGWDNEYLLKLLRL